MLIKPHKWSQGWALTLTIIIFINVRGSFFLMEPRKTSESNVFFFLSHHFLCSKPKTTRLYHGFYQVSGALLEWVLFCFYSRGCSLFDGSQLSYRNSHCQTKWSSGNICDFIVFLMHLLWVLLICTWTGSFFLVIFSVRASPNKIVIDRMTVYQECHVLYLHIIWIFISF